MLTRYSSPLPADPLPASKTEPTSAGVSVRISANQNDAKLMASFSLENAMSPVMDLAAELAARQLPFSCATLIVEPINPHPTATHSSLCSLITPA